MSDDLETVRLSWAEFKALPEYDLVPYPRVPGAKWKRREYGSQAARWRLGEWVPGTVLVRWRRIVVLAPTGGKSG